MQMQKIVVFKAENEKRAALSLKKKELRKAFNFTTGDFTALIDSLINEEPESETLEILKLEDKMSRKQYCSFCELVESERITQIKREIHEIRACTWQSELKNAQRNELSHLFSSVSFDSAPLVNAILQEVEIVDSLQDTMDQEEHNVLINLLESGKLTTIKRNLLSIKKMQSSSKQLDQKIKQYRSQLKEMLKDITVDTSDLVSAIIERERNEEVLLGKQMRFRDYKMLQKIIESEQFLQIKDDIKNAYDSEHSSLLQLEEKREELTQKLKSFEINLNPLITNLIQGTQTNSIIAGFKEVMSFRHFKELTSIVSTQSAAIGEIINHNKQQQLNPYELEKRQELRTMFNEFHCEQLQNLIMAILNQSPEDDIIKSLQLKLVYLEFRRFQTIMKSQELSTIRKNIQDWRKDQNKREQLREIFLTFNIDSRELVEAIKNSQPLLDRSLTKLAEEMSAREFNSLIRLLDGEQLDKYYTSSEGQRYKLKRLLNEFDQKTRIVSRAFLSEKLEPSVQEWLLSNMSNKLEELSYTIESVSHSKCPSLPFALSKSQTISGMKQQNSELELICNQLRQRIQEESRSYQHDKQQMFSEMAKLSSLKEQQEWTIADLRQRNEDIQRQLSEYLLKIEELQVENDKYKTQIQELQTSSQQLLQQAQILLQKGKDNSSNENYTQARECFSRCLNIQIEVVGKRGRETAQTLRLIGGTYLCQQSYSKAIEPYKQCVSIIEEHNDEKDADEYSDSLHRLELCYQLMKDFKSGVEYFEQRLLHNQRINYQKGVKKCAKWLAKNLLALGEKQRAVELKKKYKSSF